jgi:phosphopantetheine--protein transferase-like protein
LTPIAQLLAPGCFGTDMEDTGQDVSLCPLDAGFIESAAPKRRRDFALGRFCAHAALVQMGRDEPAIPIGTAGAPVWPTGIIGSITHTRGYAAAAVASQERFLAVGIDAERIGGVTEALMPRLFGPAERDWLMAQDAGKRASLLTIFFSAKEAFFKAFGAQMENRLAFRDIHIVLRDGGFTVRHGGRVAQGRLSVQGDLVVTAVIVPAS